MLDFPNETDVQNLIATLAMKFFSNIVSGLLIVFLLSFGIVYLFRNLSLWEDLTNVLLSLGSELKNDKQRRLFEVMIKIIVPPFALSLLYIITVVALSAFGIIVPKLSI